MLPRDRLEARMRAQRSEARLHHHERQVHLPARVRVLEPVQCTCLVTQARVDDGDLKGTVANARVEIFEAAKDVARLAFAAAPAEQIPQGGERPAILAVNLERLAILGQRRLDVAFRLECHPERHVGPYLSRA